MEEEESRNSFKKMVDEALKPITHEIKKERMFLGTFPLKNPICIFVESEELDLIKKWENEEYENETSKDGEITTKTIYRLLVESVMAKRLAESMQRVLREEKMKKITNHIDYESDGDDDETVRSKPGCRRYL